GKQFGPQAEHGDVHVCAAALTAVVLSGFGHHASQAVSLLEAIDGQHTKVCPLATQFDVDGSCDLSGFFADHQEYAFVHQFCDRPFVGAGTLNESLDGECVVHQEGESLGVRHGCKSDV